MISGISNYSNSIYTTNNKQNTDAVSGATRKGHRSSAQGIDANNMSSTSSSNTTTTTVDAVTSATKTKGGDHYFEAQA